MEIMFSQWVLDLIGCLAFFLFWLPLVFGVVLIAVTFYLRNKNKKNEKKDD